MASYSIATTKDNLSALIQKALAGEEVVITRRGKATARIVADVAQKPGKDVRGAVERQREWLATQKPITTGIPYERFYEWLYEDDDV